MNRNLGETSLKKRPRKCDPMLAYDALPKELRQRSAQAVLPWSPSSAHKLWNRAQLQGLSVDDALAFLRQARRNLVKNHRSPQQTNHAQNFKLDHLGEAYHAESGFVDLAKADRGAGAAK